MPIQEITPSLLLTFPLSSLEMLPTFKDQQLLERALTHSSYANEHLNEPTPALDNERLEFLGDAVLDFIAGAWLYEMFPDLDEGRLTSMRAALVKVSALA